jgi:hypothetical protein
MLKFVPWRIKQTKDTVCHCGIRKNLSKFILILVFAWGAGAVVPASATGIFVREKKENESIRKSNKNYSNACRLLSKKRSADAKRNRRKHKTMKWR